MDSVSAVGMGLFDCGKEGMVQGEGVKGKQGYPMLSMHSTQSSRMGILQVLTSLK